MNERTAVMAGAIAGAAAGIAVSYLLFTERGRQVRERIEPTIDNFREEFARFRSTFEKVGVMATEGVRAVQEFNAARSRSRFPGGTISH